MMTTAMEPLLINGSTRIYCIVGNPIAQVGSPQVYTARFRAAGINAVLVPFHVMDEHFEETLRGLMAIANLDGIIITVPYKARMVQFAHKLGATGRAIGAINVLHRETDGTWSGDHFDGRGLIRALAKDGISLAGKRAMLVGTGGAGSAVAYALADAGAAAITLFDLDAAKAQRLLDQVAAVFPKFPIRLGPPTPGGHDVLINATPVGMKPGDGMPAPFEKFDPSLLVIDIIIKDEGTRLIRHAKASGCRTIDGRYMLEGQVEEVMQFFGLAR